MAFGPQVFDANDERSWYNPKEFPSYIGRNVANTAAGAAAVVGAKALPRLRLGAKNYHHEFGDPVVARETLGKTLGRWRGRVFDMVSKVGKPVAGFTSKTWAGVVDSFRKTEPGKMRNFYRAIYRTPGKVKSAVGSVYSKALKPIGSAAGSVIQSVNKDFTSNVLSSLGRVSEAGSAKLSGAAASTGSKVLGGLGKAGSTALKYTGKGLLGAGKAVASKAGMAAGFAVAGMSDGIRAGLNYLSERSSMSASDMDYYDKYGPGAGKIFGQALKRLGTFRGLLRGIDGALFGLPSFIPGVGAWINSDEYLETDASMFDGDAVVKLHSDIDELDRKGASAEEYVKLFKDHDERELAHLAKREDIDGNKLAVLDHVPRKDKNGEIVKDGKGNIVYDQVWRDMSQDEAKAQVEMRRNISKSTAAERRMMLSDHGKDVDAVSIRSALYEIEADYAKKLDEIRNHYNDYENWSANAFSGKRERSRYVVNRGTMSNEEYRTAVDNARDDWASMALDNLERQNERRRKSIMMRDKYAEVIEKNRSDALSAFLSVAGGTYDSADAATSRFNEFWNSQSDAYRENITGQEMTRQLIEALRTRGQNSIQEG